jgi:hypothetical protein
MLQEVLSVIDTFYARRFKCNFFLRCTLSDKWKEAKVQAYKCFKETADDDDFMFVRFDGCRRL